MKKNLLIASLFAASAMTFRNAVDPEFNAAAGQGAAPDVPKAAPLTKAEKFAKRIELLTKRIADDTAALAEVELELATSSRLSGVVAGTAVVARIGRADTSREVNARVLGVQELDNGSMRYKIVFGEGIDTDIGVIQASQIVQVIEEAVAA